MSEKKINKTENILEYVKNVCRDVKTEYTKFMEKYGLYFWITNR